MRSRDGEWRGYIGPRHVYCKWTAWLVEKCDDLGCAHTLWGYACVIQPLWLPNLLSLSGGEGKRGKVIQIQDWDHNYPGSGVLVEWESGYRNLYRLSFRGKVRPVPYPLPVKLKQEWELSTEYGSLYRIYKYNVAQ